MFPELCARDFPLSALSLFASPFSVTEMYGCFLQAKRKRPRTPTPGRFLGVRPIRDAGYRPEPGYGGKVFKGEVSNLLLLLRALLQTSCTQQSETQSSVSLLQGVALEWLLNKTAACLMFFNESSVRDTHTIHRTFSLFPCRPAWGV